MSLLIKKNIIFSVLAFALLFIGCRESENRIDLSVFLYQPNGKITYKHQSGQRTIHEPQIMPEQGTIITGSFAEAIIQFNEFMAILIEEKSEFSYEIVDMDWPPPYTKKIILRIVRGSVLIQYKATEQSSLVYTVANQYFQPLDSGTFHLTSIIETQENPSNSSKLKTVNVSVYLTALIIKGGLHYISPITGKIDMLISINNKLTVKNNMPLEILPLNNDEITHWNKQQAKVPILSRRKMNEKIYNLPGSFSDSELAGIVLLSMIILIILAAPSWIMFRRFRINQVHSFQGILTYWTIAEKVKEKKEIRWSRRRGQVRIFIGNRGYCHIRIKEWPSKRRAFIQAYFDGKKENYTLHHSQNQVVFLRQKTKGFLSDEDEFIIDSFQFHFSLPSKYSQF